MSNKDGRIRKNVLLNAQVQIVLKEDQQNGRLTKGVVAEILTNTAKHPHGIKVQLTSGEIGRVRKVLSAKKGAVENAEPAPLKKKSQNLPWERY